MVNLTSVRIFLVDSSHSTTQSTYTSQLIFHRAFFFHLQQVLSLAIFFAFFFRNTDKDREAEEFIGEDHPALDNDEEFLHSNEVRRSQLFNKKFSYKPFPFRKNLHLLIDPNVASIV